MKRVCRIGLDIAKNFFQVHGSDEFGNKVFNRQLTSALLYSNIKETLINSVLNL